MKSHSKSIVVPSHTFPPEDVGQSATHRKLDWMLLQPASCLFVQSVQDFVRVFLVIVAAKNDIYILQLFFPLKICDATMFFVENYSNWPNRIWRSCFARPLAVMFVGKCWWLFKLHSCSPHVNRRGLWRNVRCNDVTGHVSAQIWGSLW